jgi:RimJ/RimL family protein N-acetyltransferase
LLPAQGHWLQLALHHLETGELVGDLALHALEGEAKRFEIGFTISRANQRKGFAKEALTGLLDYLVANQAVEGFIATPDSRNQGSIGLLLSLGFIQDPSKSWIEQFKGETVTVYFFERA